MAKMNRRQFLKVGEASLTGALSLYMGLEREPYYQAPLPEPLTSQQELISSTPGSLIVADHHSGSLARYPFAVDTTWPLPSVENDVDTTWRPELTDPSRIYTLIRRPIEGSWQVLNTKTDQITDTSLSPNEFCLGRRSVAWSPVSGEIYYIHFSTVGPDAIKRHNFNARGAGEEVVVDLPPMPEGYTLSREGISVAKSPNGQNRLAYSIIGIDNSQKKIYIIDLDDRSSSKLIQTIEGAYIPTLSPNGDSLCYIAQDPRQRIEQLYLLDLNDSNSNPITLDQYASGQYVAYSPDGNKIAWPKQLGYGIGVLILYYPSSNTWNAINLYPTGIPFYWINGEKLVATRGFGSVNTAKYHCDLELRQAELLNIPISDSLFAPSSHSGIASQIYLPSVQAQQDG